jgi:hypothetical protein
LRGLRPLGRGTLRRGPLLRLFGLGTVRFGRRLRNIVGAEADHGETRRFVRGPSSGAQRQQEQEQEPFDQQGEADGERAAPGRGAEPLDEGRRWGRFRLKQ